ncbi:response regulator [Kineosporia succinea]|uniref:CheY-like chemotaxis protein n=1 Tax=Kineosporia succinea TaxID=84632 RepID=A0ABT9NYS1_9ACTN|nr:response regulator [Kineosporia succinea]MDP9825589.1 CheY-like chemotaxis protein [Kineosporia succinea]
MNVLTQDRLLLVDDDPTDQEMITHALVSAGWAADRMDCLNDGAEALDYLHRREAFTGRGRHDPRVVLCDLKMPRVDGLELLREIKSDPLFRHIPVVMFTGSEGERDIQQCYDRGANGFLVKPMRPAEFRSMLADFATFWLIHNRSVSTPTHDARLGPRDDGR